LVGGAKKPLASDENGPAKPRVGGGNQKEKKKMGPETIGKCEQKARCEKKIQAQ